MSGIEKLDDMIREVVESIITAKDFTAKDFEQVARELYPEHAELIISVIKNKPQFMELWGAKPDVEEMYLAVVESLPKDYTEEQFIRMAKNLFPSRWKEISKI